MTARVRLRTYRANQAHRRVRGTHGRVRPGRRIPDPRARAHRATRRTIDPATITAVALALPGSAATSIRLPRHRDGAHRRVGPGDGIGRARRRRTRPTRRGRGPARVDQRAAFDKNFWRFDPDISWYGPGFYGSGTACGQAYTRRSWASPTAASRAGRWSRSATRPTAARSRSRSSTAARTSRAGTWDMSKALCDYLDHCYTGTIEWRWGGAAERGPLAAAAPGAAATGTRRRVAPPGTRRAGSPRPTPPRRAPRRRARASDPSAGRPTYASNPAAQASIRRSLSAARARVRVATARSANDRASRSPRGCATGRSDARSAPIAYSASDRRGVRADPAPGSGSSAASAARMYRQSPAARSRIADDLRPARG